MFKHFKQEPLLSSFKTYNLSGSFISTSYSIGKTYCSRWIFLQSDHGTLKLTDDIGRNSSLLVRAADGSLCSLIGPDNAAKSEDSSVLQSPSLQQAFEIMTLRTGLNCGHFRICSIRTMTSRALYACRCMPIGTKALGTCSRTAEREDGE